MKKFLFLIVFALTMTQLFAQNASKSSGSESKEDRNYRIPLIGEKAPSFTAETTTGTLNFPSDYGRKWKILFSHPQDFTPVCSTEILELAHLQSQLDKLGIKIAVISADPVETHLQWKKSLESLNLNNQGTVKISFPLIGDDDIKISKLYGMIHPETNSTRSVRGVFIIDPKNIIQAFYFYPMTVGRSTDELIRMISALQTTEASEVLTPVNWQAGNDVLMPYNPGNDAVKPGSEPDGYYSPAWYMWFKKQDKSTAGK